MNEYRLMDYLEVDKLVRFIDNSQITSDREKLSWDFFVNSIKSQKEDVIISVEIDNNEIVSASCCYSFAAMWNKSRNLIPYWVIGITRSLNSAVPVGDRWDKLLIPSCLYFESIGYTSVYMSRLISKKVTYENCDEYVKTLASRLGTTRYNCSVEKLVDKLIEYPQLPSFYKLFAHDTWPAHKQLAIMRYDLKYSIRT